MTRSYNVFDNHQNPPKLEGTFTALNPHDALRLHSAKAWGDTDGYFDCDRYSAHEVKP